ncbi:MAG: glycosyltransferase [Desulfocurvibacter africanus]
MRVLFIHPNFPAQFRYLAAAFGSNPANQVVFATRNERPEWVIPGVRKLLIPATAGLGKQSPQVHPFARGFENAVRNGEDTARALSELKSEGFVPDIIYGHSGWGMTLFLKDIFPSSAFLAYCEWFYRAQDSDVDFDPVQPPNWRTTATVRAKNASILLDLESCDMGCSPTAWQRAQFPREFQPKLACIHDGIDTDYFCPAVENENPLELPGLDLSAAREIVTYATRGMEPYRGFPQFMEAAALVLKERPGCHIVVAGEDRVCYGKPLPAGQSYKQQALDRLDLDTSRLHFSGALPYGRYRRLLQASDVHVYLTQPFVLSWSLLEAMSCGCLVVASDTQPVREVLRHEVDGLLTPFFSPEQLAATVSQALERKAELRPLRESARETIEQRFALKRLMPAHMKLMRTVLGNRKPEAKASVSVRSPSPA